MSPDPARGLPGGAGDVPDAARAVPGGARGVPDGAREVPDGARRLPGGARGLAGAARAVPGTAAWSVRPGRRGNRMTGARIVVGIGARPGVRAASVRALLGHVAAVHGIDVDDAVFATVEARADEPGLTAAVGDRRLVVWPAAELAEEDVPHPSDGVAAAVGTPSVAEAAALRTARTLPGVTRAEIVVPKIAGDGVTIAVAAAR